MPSASSRIFLEAYNGILDAAANAPSAEEEVEATTHRHQHRHQQLKTQAQAHKDHLPSWTGLGFYPKQTGPWAIQGQKDSNDGWHM
jgi:hypothetical protein